MSELHLPSRRGFIKLGGAAALTMAGSGLITSCGTAGGAGGAKDLKFWDMPWANATYTDEAKRLVTEAFPAGNGAKWSYQQVQWANFYQTYSSAVASRTNPAASTGGGFQAVGLSGDGAIHYADNVIEKLKKSGKYDDWLPNLFESQKTKNGYLGIPWEVDIPALYYLKSVHDENGLTVPKTWDDIFNNGLVLKKKGIDALITGSGSGNNRGHQTIASLMINNGGGLFDEDGNLDVMYERNVEAVEFLLELVKEGMINPSSVNYTEDNMATVWRLKQGAVGFQPPNYALRIPGAVGDMLVASPLTGPHGDKGAMAFINSVMMYKNNPSVQDTEDFVEWYTTNNDTFWTKSLGVGLAIRKSVLATPSEAANTEQKKILDEYLPVAKGLYARGKEQFPAVALIDGSQSFFKFAQNVLGGRTTAKEALQSFESDLASIIKKK